MCEHKREQGIYVSRLTVNYECVYHMLVNGNDVEYFVRCKDCFFLNNT